eukprot:gene8319-9209_t
MESRLFSQDVSLYHMIFIEEEMDRWVQAYRKDRILVDCNTNSGTERQNTSSKYQYLERRTTNSLSVILTKRWDKISYPIYVEQTAYQLLRPNWSYLDMCIVDGQQQKGGIDCGLFEKSPIKAIVQQDMLREALVNSFEMRKMSNLVDSALAPSTAAVTKPVMFHWNCKVYCHYRMPDNGKLMVLYSC